jgi:endonuclease YncB( thermonuclease family)
MEDSARPMYLLMNDTDDGTSRWVLKGVMNTDLDKRNAYLFTNVSDFQVWLIKTGNNMIYYYENKFILKVA